MKHKLNVYYTVQYVKEVELEINEEIEEHFKHDEYLTCINNSLLYKLQEINEDVLSELPIPDSIRNDKNFDLLEAEYIDDSFEIDYFKI